ncbi:MAG TPA: rhodanese-like domain-containing protein [Burkholderiaceae bacterium]|nr:rhodanese-like domain-containing protein [Burkholderiaceae bacterium]
MNDTAFTNISPEQARAMLDSGEISAVIDTREMHEWTAERIRGSHCVPVPSGEAQVLQRLQTLGLPKETPVLVHCRSGARSMRVMPQILAYGFTQVYHLPTGILGWRAAGMPTVTGESTSG